MSLAVLLLVLMAPAVMAQPVERRRVGFLLKLDDYLGLIKQPPTVSLKGSMGTSRRVFPKDNGELPDMKAGDNVYTYPVMDFPDPVIDVFILSGGRQWVGKGTMEDNDVRTMLVFRLQPDGRAHVPGLLDEKKGPSPVGAVATGAPSTPGKSAGASSWRVACQDFAHPLSYLLFFLLGFGAAASLGYLSRRRR